MIGLHCFPERLLPSYDVLFINMDDSHIRFSSFVRLGDDAEEGGEGLVEAERAWPDSGLSGRYLAYAGASYRIEDFRANAYFLDGCMFGMKTFTKAIRASDRGQDERTLPMLFLCQAEGYDAGLFVPDTECGFEECLLVVGHRFGEKEIAVLSNRPVRELPRGEAVIDGILPVLELQGPPLARAGDAAELTLRVVGNALNLDSLYWICVACDNGALSARRFKLGVGESRTLTLATAGLRSGDTITVSAGIEAAPHLVRHLLRVREGEKA